MKRVFPHIGRRLRLFLAAFLKLSLLFFPAEGRCAEAARPAQGFIMDMAPLLGDNGRISAIAPGCRAMTGIMDGEAILWSRDFGLLRVVLPEDQYGMGNFLSDDGRSMAGFVSSRRDQPSPGVVWSRPGFLWRYDGTRQPMSRHGLEDVVWYGMSADGRVALGYGKKPIPGAPAADAPFEEHARFAQTPEGKAARNRGFLTHSEFWFCIEDGQRFRRMDEMGTIVTSPYFRVLSRDGKKILDKKDNVVHIVDRQTGRDRILRFGGAAPFRGGNPPAYEGSIVRAGDPRTPLYRWGRWRGFYNGRQFTDHDRSKAEPGSPMYDSWLLKDFFCFIPSFDARFVLAEAWLERFDAVRMTRRRGNLNVLARLDEAGNGVVIDDRSGLMGLDISDNGRIVLYQRDVEIRIWNEDFILPGDTCPRNMSLARYLKLHGLELPEGLFIALAVMSPDGRCFFMELASRRDDTFPLGQFLACTDPAVEPPYWKRPGRRDDGPAR